jgi:hypothetical protein
MRSVLAVILLVTAPATASADRLTVGVSVAESDGAQRPDGVEGRGVFGRLRLGGPVWAEVELARGTTESGYDARRLAGAALVELSAGGRATPYLLGAVAAERAANGVSGHDDFQALELGAGVSVRVVDQLVVGADVRFGERTHVGSSGNDVITLWAPGLVEGEYTSVRLTVGVAF